MKKRTRMNVYLHGWFGFRNVGDDILCKEMLGILTALDAVDAVTVGASEQDYLDRFLGDSSKVRFSRRSTIGLFGKALKYDVLIVGPGGLFPHSDTLKVFVFLCVTLFWKALGKSVICFGIGANSRWSRLAQSFWRLIACMSDLFVPRDSVLFEACGIQQSAKAYVGTDLVFLRGAQTFSGSGGRFSSKRVGVAFANILEEHDPMAGELMSSCVELVGAVVGAGGCTVDLLSFTAGADERFNEAVAEAVGSRNVAVLSYEETLRDIDQLGSYDLVVGMRFHAILLAALEGAPFVGISYSDKTEKLAESLGCGDHVLLFCGTDGGYYGRPISLDASRLMHMVREALEQPLRYAASEKAVARQVALAQGMKSTLCRTLDDMR